MPTIKRSETQKMCPREQEENGTRVFRRHTACICRTSGLVKKRVTLDCNVKRIFG